MNSYTLNRLDQDTIQIYGGVTGSAFRTRLNGSRDCYSLNIRFFNGRKIVKIQTNTPLFIPESASEDSVLNRIRERIDRFIERETA